MKNTLSLPLAHNTIPVLHSPITWFEEEVQQLEAEKAQLPYSPAALFYGSSTIRLWQTLDTDFKEYRPVNLGFGGSTLAACAWYFNRIMAPYHPELLVVYAGDNDLGDGREPEEVFLFFQQLVLLTRQRFTDQLPCYFVSLKPSPSRWHLIEKYKRTNSLLEAEIRQNLTNWQFINIFDPMLNNSGQPNKAYFEEDDLHLNAKGYELWARIIRSYLPPIKPATALL